MPEVTATVNRKTSFLHLSVGSELTDTDRAAIERALDKAKDWIRYFPNCWLLYTSRTPRGWFEILEGIENLKEYKFFICEVNIKNKSGWLPRSTWELINKSRE